MDLIREIEMGLKKPGKSRTGLAKALGVGASTITDMLGVSKTGKPRRIRVDELPKIRAYLELDPAVPIVGRVGASAEMLFYGEGADDPAETVPAPHGASPFTVAVEIKGDSLGTGFDGWLAFYDDRRAPITPDLLGRLCVVSLDDGRVLIKTPRQAKAIGYYHLYSAAGGDPIPDVRIEWAAKVKSIAPKS